jgi:cobalamin synthase
MWGSLDNRNNDAYRDRDLGPFVVAPLCSYLLLYMMLQGALKARASAAVECPNSAVAWVHARLVNKMERPTSSAHSRHRVKESANVTFAIIEGMNGYSWRTNTEERPVDAQ